MHSTSCRLLKHELGFEGFVVSDWGAQHTGIASAESGLDMAMPNSPYWSGNLSVAVANGSLSQARLDDMTTRILAAWYKLNPEPNPGHGVPVNLSLPHQFTNARNPASKTTLRQGAVEGHVLVKNKGALPFNAPPFLSLFGYDAYAPLQNDFAPAGFGKWALGDESVANLTDAGVITFFLGTNYTNAPACKLCNAS